MKAAKTPSPRRKLGPIIGGAATALSLVLGVVAIVPILTANASSVDKLDVSIERYRPDDVLLYAIPLTRVADLPFEAGDACGPARLSWLDAHGIALPGYHFVTITNRATSGNVIGFSKVVVNGESSPPDEAHVIIECDQNAPNRIAPIMVNASSGQPGYYDRSRMADAGESPDVPLVYNLAPGETGQFVLLVTSAEAFQGHVQYTVTSGADRMTGVLDLGGPVVLPGTRPFSSSVVLAGDPFWACAAQTPATECRS